MAALLVPIFLYSDSTSFPGLAACAPVLGAALILISPKGRINGFLLSSKPLVTLGLVSYSWYLWHWPLLSFARISAGQPISKTASLAIVITSLGLAACSYRFVEQPFRKSKLAAVPLLQKYAILCALMLLPPLAFLARKGLPNRFPQLTLLEQESGIQDSDTCLVGYGASAPHLSSLCVPKTDPRGAVALLGDSHAAALGEAMRESAGKENLKLYEIAKSSCPPLLGITRLIPKHPGHDRECAQFNAMALDIVRDDPRVGTVVLAGYWSTPFREAATGSRYQIVSRAKAATEAESEGNLFCGLSDLVGVLRASGKRVVVIQDDPLFSFDPVRRLRWSMIPIRGRISRILAAGVDAGGSVPRSATSNRDDDMAYAIVEKAAGTATLFDLKKNLCDSQKCFYSSGGKILYSDPQHLSLAGGRIALQGIALIPAP